MLGLWIEQTEGAKFWLKVVNELKARGVNDILIAVVDGLKGFPKAITSVFPQTIVQTCIVHLIRNSLAFVSWKEPQGDAAGDQGDLSRRERRMALTRLEEFEAEWSKRYPRGWGRLAPDLGARRAVLRLRARHPQDDLHHHRGGGAAPITAQDHQDARQLPQRRRGAEAALPRDQECWPALAAVDRMDTAMSQFAIQFGERFPG